MGSIRIDKNTIQQQSEKETWQKLTSKYPFNMGVNGRFGRLVAVVYQRHLQ